MSFDLVDAYVNITENKKDIDYLIARMEFIIDKLKAEGIFDEKDFEKWIKKKQEEVKNGK